jgi:hypothetical protein
MLLNRHRKVGSVSVIDVNDEVLIWFRGEALYKMLNMKHLSDVEARHGKLSAIPTKKARCMASLSCANATLSR